jgi:hypothetical protein
MFTRKRKRVERMRLMVNCLPYETRVAMLEGLRRYDIIAGAYTSREGGVCPMLAAHRCGGRTDFRAFAQAWDRFTGATKRARKATERELRTLRVHLEASVWSEDTARAEMTRIEVVEPRPSVGKERSGQVEVNSGLPERFPAPATGAWLIPFRDWDSYVSALERALAEFEGGEPNGSSSPEAPEAQAAALNG